MKELESKHPVWSRWLRTESLLVGMWILANTIDWLKDGQVDYFWLITGLLGGLSIAVTWSSFKLREKEIARGIK